MKYTCHSNECPITTSIHSVSLLCNPGINSRMRTVKGAEYYPAIECPNNIRNSPFEWGCIIGLRETGRTQRIAAHVGYSVPVVCRRFQQWCVEHLHTRRTGSERPRSTDARHDRYNMRAALAVSREEIRVNVVPAASSRTIGNRLLAVDSDRV